jgi:hypothetical protein
MGVGMELTTEDTEVIHRGQQGRKRIVNGCIRLEHEGIGTTVAESLVNKGFILPE